MSTAERKGLNVKFYSHFGDTDEYRMLMIEAHRLNQNRLMFTLMLIKCVEGFRLDLSIALQM